MMRSSYISPMISDSGRRPSSSARRVVSPSGGLLRPRGESYPRQAAFFDRAASRIPVRRPSSTARRVASPSGGLLRPRSESHPRQAAFFDRAASRIPVRSPSSSAQTAGFSPARAPSNRSILTNKNRLLFN